MVIIQGRYKNGVEQNWGCYLSANNCRQWFDERELDESSSDFFRWDRVILAVRGLYTRSTGG